MQLGGEDGYALTPGISAIVTFNVSANDSAISLSFRNQSLAFYENDDSDGDGFDDILLEIPNCITEVVALDGR